MLFVDWLEWIGNIMIPHSSGPGPVLIGSGRLLHLMTFSLVCVQFLLLSLTRVTANYVVVMMVKQLQGRKMDLYDKGLYPLLPTFAFSYQKEEFISLTRFCS